MTKDNDRWVGENITIDTEFYLELLKDQQKLQALEEKLTECAHNYWKEVEERKALEEENKILRDAVENIPEVIDGNIAKALVDYVVQIKEALEKTKRGNNA